MSTKISKQGMNKILTDRLAALQEIATQMMKARNPRDLLVLILDRAMELMVCDAGSVYIKLSDQEIAFEVAVNQSIKINYERRVVPLSGDGIAVYTYREGKALNIKDVYQLPVNSPYSFDKSFDQKTNYRTRSMLVQPMINSKGECLGVIQLINKKEQKQNKWPSNNEKRLEAMPIFSAEDTKLLESFASLAAAALENANLYHDIESLFEGFVKASVNAIETRDPSTKGHSERVALLTVDLAQKIHRSDDLRLKNITFRDEQIAELRYAALLHDFGKIGVREQTLSKMEKLSPMQQQEIRARLDKFIHEKEVHLLRELLTELYDKSRTPNDFDIKKLEKQLNEFRKKYTDCWNLILEVNKPTVVTEDRSLELQKLSKQGVLSEDELKILSIRKGSLTEAERQEIEQHVTQTYNFLRSIPWTKGFANVPDIAHAHHEKLDGSGYPRRIKADLIPVQSRIMTICDIFDALVAADRPYKRALPFDKAFSILEDESKSGKIDKALFKVFMDGKVFELPAFMNLISGDKKKVA